MKYRGLDKTILDIRFIPIVNQTVLSGQVFLLITAVLKNSPSGAAEPWPSSNRFFKRSFDIEYHYNNIICSKENARLKAPPS